MKEALRAEAEGTFEYQSFWGHKGAGVGPHVLSQWWPVTFTIGNYRFSSAEMAMMAAKAIIFKDTEALEAILAAPTPKEVKAWGRKVRNFDQAVWESRRFEIVLKANLAKFTQHPDLGSYLRSTAPRTLIEASPYDRVWGIGLGPSSPFVAKPSQWKGLNLLGFALTEVRTML